MSSVESGYYHSLSPFEKLFESGWPILTYHKLGPRPMRTRLKGLYLSQRLFTKQLRELKQAGYQTFALSELAAGTAKPAQRIALTFDDGFGSVLEFGLRPLAEQGFQAMMFLVADRLGQTNDWDAVAGEISAPLMDAAQVREWLGAGHQIGSHTLSHPFLTRISPQQAREEIAASKKKLEDLFSVPVEHFCYPYGDWNPAVRELVAEAGYRTACTTDFGVNPPGTEPFALTRITARYPSRSWKTVKAWFRRHFGSKG